MTAFVDTSALYALLYRGDGNHEAAAAFARSLEPGAAITHSYVVVEASALLQRRLGLAPVRALHAALVPALRVVWVDETLHQRAVAALLSAEQRRVSLVDRASFEVMRSTGLRHAFAFDDDFAVEGFTLVP